MKMPQLNPAGVASPITRQLLLLLLLFGCCFPSSVATGTNKLHPGSLRAKELVTYTVEQLGSVTNKLSNVAGHFNPSAGMELSVISNQLLDISGLLNSTDLLNENIALGATLPSNTMFKQLEGTIDELQSLVWYARRHIRIAAAASSRHAEEIIHPKTSTESSTTNVAEAVTGSPPKERPDGSAGNETSSGGRPYFVNEPLPMQAVVALDAPAGTAVYTLQASDPDPNDDLHFLLVRDRTGGRLEVDERSGVVHTRDSDPFLLNLEYVLYVKVEDHANLDEDGKFQRSEDQRLSIVGGRRKPQFFQSSYGTNVTENYTLNAEVLTVKAKSFNGNDIRYTMKSYELDNIPFSIEVSTGVVKLTNPLDYEDRRQLHVYQLEVMALEESPEMATKVQMEIRVTDVNDNSPKFDLPYYQVSGVPESTAIGSELARVSATDADSGVNSRLSYSLPEIGTRSLFDVDEQGVIYNRQTLDASKKRGVYEFLVKATDGGDPPKYDTATVRLYVKNTRNDPPRFSEQVYTPSVDEDVLEDTLVTTVWAFDPDGDKVTYALTTANMPFVLNHETGEVRVKRGATLLDQDKYEMNVTATDAGSCCADGSRSGHTSTAVVVVFVADVNDNRPEFPECDSYRPTVVPGLTLWNSSAESRRFLLRVEATDRDRGTNGQIQYSLGGTGPGFDIDSDTGDVFITSEMSVREGAGERLVPLSVWATDGGSPQFQTVCNILVRITGRSDSQPVFGREEYVAVIRRDTAVGSRLLRVSAQSSSGDRVQFALTVPADAGTDASSLFSIDPHSGLVVLQKPLGEEVEYRLRVSATNTRALPPLTSYADVRLILQDSGSTTTSDTRVKDKPPVFARDHFQAEVDENAELGRPVIAVTATDPDDVVWLHYRLKEGDSGRHFTIGNYTGVIYVNTALDYEARKEHKLRVVASDGTHESHADVLIRVRDVNEYPPRFNSSIYRTQVMEEDDGELPKRILQVAATDGDTGSSVGVVYFLAGQGVDTDHPDRSTFTINQTSGEVFVTKRLDRDRPNGQSRWWLTVLAKDEGGSGLVGHANLQIDVEDVNDNPPIFSWDYFFGSVVENRTETEGAFTAKVEAEDYDDPNKPNNSKIEYSIRRNAVLDGRPIFSIEPETGIIRTNVCCLDREVTAEYSLEVMAADPGGLRGTATAVIRVKDVNDSPPRFSQDKYNIVVDETYGGNLPKDAVLKVTVLDDDANNTFFYSVLEDSGLGADKFILVPGEDNTAFLRIARPLEYEDKSNQNGFSFVIQVDDDGGSGRAAQAQVYVQLRDINDNQPIFARSSLKVNVAENIPEGYQLANFSASDADGNGDGQVFYAIDEDSDRDQQFSIDEQGSVVLQRSLDREREHSHRIRILAIDDGVPPNTATATLVVIVEDINDNPPTFLEEYSVVVPEHSVPQLVAEVAAADVDDVGNGAPFTFRLDPNADNETRRSFRVEHVPRGANGDGVALVTSQRVFDRAQRDEYLVPIIIKDSGTPALSATSTLTVRIGSRDD